MRARISSLIALPAVVVSLPLWAAEPKPGTGAATQLAPSALGGGVLLQTVLFLVLIVGLIVGLGWVVRRMGGMTAGGKGLISVVGGVSLGPRERAVVIQAGDTRLLVGVAPGRVQTLCILDGADKNNDISPQQGGEFKEKLDTELGGKGE